MGSTEYSLLGSREDEETASVLVGIKIKSLFFGRNSLYTFYSQIYLRYVAYKTSELSPEKLTENLSKQVWQEVAWTKAGLFGLSDGWWVESREWYLFQV